MFQAGRRIDDGVLPNKRLCERELVLLSCACVKEQKKKKDKKKKVGASNFYRQEKREKAQLESSLFTATLETSAPSLTRIAATLGTAGPPTVGLARELGS
ncbi:hypothetical protein VTO42DRAFT_5808 [Malbranchea cinnamomea]